MAEEKKEWHACKFTDYDTRWRCHVCEICDAYLPATELKRLVEKHYKDSQFNFQGE